jgi:hypothetical protein
VRIFRFIVSDFVGFGLSKVGKIEPGFLNLGLAFENK